MNNMNEIDLKKVYKLRKEELIKLLHSLEPGYKQVENARNIIFDRLKRDYNLDIVLLEEKSNLFSYNLTVNKEIAQKYFFNSELSYKKKIAKLDAQILLLKKAYKLKFGKIYNSSN